MENFESVLNIIDTEIYNECISAVYRLKKEFYHYILNLTPKKLYKAFFKSPRYHKTTINPAEENEFDFSKPSNEFYLVISNIY